MILIKNGHVVCPVTGTDDVMDVHRVNMIREDMERMEAHKLQPHFVEAFFIEAFKALGGGIRKREKGRWEISNVPYKVRSRDQQIGFGIEIADLRIGESLLHHAVKGSARLNGYPLAVKIGELHFGLYGRGI